MMLALHQLTEQMFNLVIWITFESGHISFATITALVHNHIHIGVPSYRFRSVRQLGP